MGELISVNVGVPRQIGVSRRGRPVISAIGKSPVTGRVAVRGVNLADDDQADRSVHGGPEKAVYAYASEDTAWWSTVLGFEVTPGAFGENLTTAGVDVSGAAIGERWRIGSTELEVCQPRQPCYKLASLSRTPESCDGSPAPAGRGPTCASWRGELGAGDAVEIVSRPDHGITIAVVADAIISDHGLLAIAARAPALPPSLAAWMRERADIAQGAA